MTETPTETTPRRVLQWDLPADDNDHPIGGGPVLHVDLTPWGFGVRIWTEEHEPATDGRLARVLGDEQPIPDDYQHLGSATTKNGAWHIYAAPTTITPEEPV
jgi:hypothetical protein